MAIVNLKPSNSTPTSTPQGKSTLLAYDQSGKPVYVERGVYYPGVSQTKPTTNIGAETNAGVDGTILPSGQTPATNIPVVKGDPSNQYDTFNGMLLDAFKASQGVTAIDLLKKQRDLQKANADVVSTAIPAGSTLSPSQQQSIISAKQNTYSAEMSDNDYQVDRANKAISNFEDLFYKAQQFGQDFTDKMVLPDSMIQNYKKVIENDPSQMSTILSTLNDKSRNAVIGALDYNKLGETTTVKTSNSSASSNSSTASTSASSNELSDDTVKFFAQSATSGVNINSLIPSLGMGSAGVAAKTKLLNEIANNAITLGIDGSTFGAMITDSKAKQATYTTLQKNASQTAVNENNANKNFAQLIGLAEKVDNSVYKTGSPILDNWIRSGTLATTGNADVNNFLALLTTTLTEYAKVVSGVNTGASVTEGANTQAQKLLSAGLSASTIKSFTVQAEKEMSNRTTSYNNALNDLFGSIKDITDTSGGGLGIKTGATTTSTPVDISHINFKQ
jgi:hypothetical protein